MIQRKKKQVKIILLIILIVAILGVGAWGVISIVNGKNTEQGQNSEQIDLSQFELKSLIVTTTLSEKELKDNYKAVEVNSLTFGTTDIETYEIKYNTEEETRTAYEKLKENGNVKNVDINEKRTVNKIIDSVFYYELTAGSEPISSWGSIAMGLDEAVETVNVKNDKQEIVVAVIDSGFDYDHAYIMKDETLRTRIKEGFNTIYDTTDVTDDDGHGTHVGSIILEGTPDNVKILPIKALEPNEEGETVGTDASIIKAINYAVKNGADVINMSLGGESTRATEQEAISNAYNKNIVCVAASGNGDKKGVAIDLDKQGVNFYPAECENVITVGAVQNKLLNQNSTTTVEDLIENYPQYKNATANDMDITTFSNYGNAVDFVAPGQMIMGLIPETDKGNIKWMSGTSQATPHISASVALLKTYNKDYTSDKIEEILAYYSHDLGDEGKDVYYGNGFVSFKGFEECECGTEECEKIYCTGCENTRCIFHAGSTNRLLNIEITTLPTDTTYIFESTHDEEEQEFKKNGMIVTANYSDGSKKIIEDYTWSPEKITGTIFDPTKFEAEVTISYTENGITKTATQKIQMECGGGEETELTSIEITTPPNSILYEVYDGDDESEFFTEGMVVTANYSDGSKKVIEDYTWSPEKITADIFTIENSEGYFGEVTISYTEGGITKTAIQRVKQVPAGGGGEESATLTSIKITTPPVKTIYNEGETFDKAGMVITATYSDGTEKLLDRYTVEPTRALTKDDTKVTISYSENGIEKTVEQAITVKQKVSEQEKQLSSIKATSNPTKTSYNEGERFNPSGMVIVANYSDGTNKIITDYTYSPSGALKSTDKKVTISYEDGTTKTIDIPITVKAANAGNSNDTMPGFNDSMFQVNNGNQSNNNGTNKREETSSTNNQQNNNAKKDETTTKENLANTGIEDSAIPIGIGIVIIVMAVSYIACKKYKEI